VGLRDLRATETAQTPKAAKVERPLFKQYREGDGQFYFKLVDAHGQLLLQSLGFATPREAGQAIARLKTDGAAALSALGEQLQPISTAGRQQLDAALQALREGD
jgi:tryptophanyl-tRNA synthetase